MSGTDSTITLVIESMRLRERMDVVIRLPCAKSCPSTGGQYISDSHSATVPSTLLYSRQLAAQSDGRIGQCPAKSVPSGAQVGTVPPYSSSVAHYNIIILLSIASGCNSNY